MKKILFSVVALLLTSTLWAQEIEKKQELKGEVSTSLSALRLATDLVKYGYSQQSAMPLAQALQIINENPTQPLKSEREGDKADTSKSGMSCPDNSSPNSFQSADASACLFVSINIILSI